MKVFVTSTVNIKLPLNVGIKLMLHIDVKNIWAKIFFNQMCFHYFFSASGNFLDTFLTSYCPHVLMSKSYLQFYISRVSKSDLLTLYHDIDQLLTSIWGSSANWGGKHLKTSKMTKTLFILACIWCQWASIVYCQWFCD